MNEIILAGCTPTPLANYLKALGIFRLVAEQKDPLVKACWRGERFALITRLSSEELTRFFLDEYRPTPVLSPWNGRAGYLEGENADESTRRGPLLLQLFRDSTSVRFGPYRDLIRTLDELEPLDEMNSIRASKKALDKEKKLNPTTWGDEKQRCLALAIAREAYLKEQLLNLLRNALPDEQLAWLDAAVAIGTDKAFAPLLGGSGGIEGSMDIGVNFLENLLFLFSTESEAGASTQDSKSWLANALHASTARLTAKNTAGSLSPERVGGPNATTGSQYDLNINPWDFVLMIEGAIAFKPSMTRKLGSTGRARMSYPFTVEPSSIGAGSVSSVDEKKTRAGASEVWMPLWSAHAEYSEIVNLLREGSVRLGTKAPRDGLDMARCIARLGIDRGMNGFQRFLFLKRSGDNDLAVPLNRFQLERERPPNADLINDLERGHFLDLVRRAARSKEASASLKRAVAQLENAMFSLTRPGAGQRATQRTLILLGQVMQSLAISRKGQEAIPVLPSLSTAWIIKANDHSTEFRLALALASLPRMTTHIAPIKRNRNSRSWQWHPGCTLYVWSKGDLTRNLVRIAERRIIESRRQNDNYEPFDSHASLGARQADIQAFLSGQTDDGRIAELLQGLVWTKLPEALPQPGNESSNKVDRQTEPVPVAYRVIKPFFAPSKLLRHLNRLPEGNHWFLPEEIPRLLVANQVNKALEAAWRRSRIAGLGWPPGTCPESTTTDGHRLLATLTIPIKPTDLARLLPRAKIQDHEPAQF